MSGMNMEEEGVASFFAGKVVLVTGATGFLGGILVEKLLRSCPLIKRIYIVVREKRGMDTQTRMKQMLSLPLYAGLKKDSIDKLSLVEGDVSQEDLGLDNTARSRLEEEVNVVFHVAACTNFNAPLVRAVKINLQGTASILQMSKAMKHIQAFVYVSTAYCNSILRDVVAEKVYPNRWHPRELIKLVYSLPQEELVKRTREILGGQPNTYSFTKQLAENLIQLEREHIPVAIVRPSIVLGTVKWPIPGWIDNVQNGAFAFIAGAGRGVFRTVPGDGSKKADLVPSDLLASLLVCSAWKAACQKGLTVYHFTSGTDNPVTWEDYTRLIMRAVQKYPCTGMVLSPKAKVRLSAVRNDVYTFFAHYIPAIFLDWQAKIRNQPQIVMDIQTKYQLGCGHTRYFTTREWLFDKRNTDALAEELSDEERREFDFSLAKLDWPEYFETCVKGIRKFFHGESDSTLPLARLLWKVWKTVDIVILVGIFMVVHYLSANLMGDPLAAVTALLSVMFYVWL